MAVDSKKLKVVDVYWENTYMHLKTNYDVDKLVLYRKKGKEKHQMIKVEEGHFKINVVNVSNKYHVLYGEYLVLYNKKPIQLDKELYKTIEDKEKLFLFPKAKAYLAFYKTKNSILRINFQTYKNIKIEDVVEVPRPKKLKNKIKKVLNKMVKYFTQFLYNVVRAITPNKDKNKNVLFLTMNKTVIDGNLIALYDYMKENTEYNLIEEAFNVFKIKNIKKVIPTIRSTIKVAKCNYIFIDNYTPLFNYLKIDKDVELIQLWHAGVGFKSVGYARFGKEGSPNLIKSSHRKYTRAIASSDKTAEIYQDVFGISKDKFIITGLPRLDGLVENREDIKEKVLNAYPELRGKRNVLFAPTYRGKGQAVARYNMKWLDLKKIDEFCRSHRINFIIKMHPFIKKLGVKLDKYTNIKDLSSYPDMNELLCVSNAMITDFSSNIYEAALLDVPIIIFAPDKENYEQTRGVHRTLDEFAGDDISRNTGELLESLRMLRVKKWQKKFKRDEVQLEHGGSCKQIVEEIFNK